MSRDDHHTDETPEGEFYEGTAYGDDDEFMTSEAREDDSWWDEGLVSLLLVTGVVLFLLPEPATSTIGIVLVISGLVLWAIDWLA